MVSIRFDFQPESLAASMPVICEFLPGRVVHVPGKMHRDDCLRPICNRRDTVPSGRSNFTQEAIDFIA
jgi:hypothetical protein